MAALPAQAMLARKYYPAFSFTEVNGSSFLIAVSGRNTVRLRRKPLKA
jgi:hypothetical protein